MPNDIICAICREVIEPVIKDGIRYLGGDLVGPPGTPWWDDNRYPAYYVHKGKCAKELRQWFNDAPKRQLAAWTEWANQGKEETDDDSRGEAQPHQEVP